MTQRIEKICIVQVRVNSVLFPAFRICNQLPWRASIFSEKNEDSTEREILNISSKGKIPPPVGFEPTTFELEVQHASPLRHGDCTSIAQNIFWLHFFFFSLNTTLFFHLSFILFGWCLLERKCHRKLRYLLTLYYSFYIFEYM